MVSLTLTIADVESPVCPDPTDLALEVWRENDGSICAYGHVVQEQYWIHFVGLASYCFSQTSDQVIAYPQPSVQLEWVWDTYYRSVVPLALQALGKEALHASAVLTQRGVIALCAVSETGKSTISYGLNQRGYSLWADDAVVFDSSDQTNSSDQMIVAKPLPFTTRLRPASADYFDYHSTNVSGDMNSKLMWPSAKQPSPLAAIVVMERAPDSEGKRTVEICRISPAQAFPAVLTHAYCFSLQSMERKQRMMHAYMNLVKKIPVFTIRFSAGLDQLPHLLEQIETQIIHSAKGLNRQQVAPF